MRHHCSDACRRCASRGIEHQQQLHQVLLYGRHDGLDYEDISLTTVGVQLHTQTIVAEARDGSRTKSFLEMTTYFSRKVDVRAAAKNDDRSHELTPYWRQDKLAADKRGCSRIRIISFSDPCYPG